MKLPKILIIAVTIVIFISAEAAQKQQEKKITIEKPDMEQIKRDVSDPDSKYYYPRLMRQYEMNETIMTLQDYRHLYLGMIFQEDYDPYRTNEKNEYIEQLYYKQTHTRIELDSIISHATKALKNDPFDFTQINYLIFAYRKRQKNNIANIWQYRLNHLLEAIVSTGTGLDTDNAWVVINPRHEYNIINFQNTIAESQQYVEPYFDYITIKKINDKTPQGYFFNIRYILEEYYRKYPEEYSDDESEQY